MDQLLYATVLAHATNQILDILPIAIHFIDQE
jgi:hypothetical protein